MNSNSARECVEYFSNMPRQGPFVLDPISERNAESIQRFDEIVGSIPKSPDHVWHAPSPWHAAILLIRAAHYNALFETPGALLFRGQRNSSWPVVASIYRKTGSNQLALDVFCAAMAGLMWEEVSDARREMHIACAQHYGLQTPLLDFTTDPRIALYFACLNAAEGDEAAVYWLPFNLAVLLGVQVTLAPPWVHRHHIQQGLFLDLKKKIDLAGGCSKVVFPVSKEYVTWLDGSVDGLILEKNDWLERACAWASNFSGPAPGSPEAANSSFSEDLVAQIGPPPFITQSLDPAAWTRTATQLVELCNWLSLRARKETDELEYRCMPLMILRRDNPGAFKAIEHVSKYVPKDSWDTLPMGSFLRALDRCLTENTERQGQWSVLMEYLE